MSKYGSGTVIFLAAALAVCFSLNAFAGLEAVGRYDIKNVMDIQIEDLDNDGLKEVIVSSDDRVCVLDGNASLKWSFNAENLRSVHVSDTNGNKYKEVIISSGAEVNKVERGNIYILNKNGRIEQKYEFKAGDAYPHLLLYSIAATDIDNNRYKEVIGGSSNGVYALRDTFDKIRWSYKTNETITGITLRGPGGGDIEIMANSFTKIHMLDLDGNLKGGYTVAEGIKDIYVADVDSTTGDEMIILSKKDMVYILDEDFNTVFENRITDDVLEIKAFDLDNNGLKEMVLGSDSGIYIINNRYRIASRYPTGGPVHGIYYADWDGDTKKEIVFGSGSYIHLINDMGELLDNGRIYAAENIERFVQDDLDSDGFIDVIIYSRNSLYFFENKEARIKELARKSYITARSYYEMERYEDSARSLNESMRLYASIEDSNGLEDCKTLLGEMETKIFEEKTRNADRHYQAAERYVREENYQSAIDELSKAEQIYSELQNEEGMNKCGLLAEEIKTKETGENKKDFFRISSILESSKDANVFPIFSIFLLVAIILLLAILIVKRK